MTETKILKFFADYIESQVGIVYTDVNYFQLDHRLHDIAHQLGMKNVDELYSRATQSLEGSFKNLLLDLATNNETSFYRDAHVFTALGRIIIPDLLEMNPNLDSLRIWSAAASSGQEIYTIAMELEQLRKSGAIVPSTQFLASDISETILKRAQTGIYSQLEVQRGLPARLLIENFDQIDDNQWKVKDKLKRDIEFRKINLLEPWYGLGHFEIIYCRNVLIYQNVENKKKVLNKFLEILKPGGYLVLGAAESVFGLSEDFEVITQDKTILFKKK